MTSDPKQKNLSNICVLTLPVQDGRRVSRPSVSSSIIEGKSDYLSSDMPRGERVRQSKLEGFVDSNMEERLLKAIKESTEHVRDSVKEEISRVKEDISSAMREVRQDLQKLSDKFEEDLKEVREEGEKEREELRAELEKLAYHHRKYNLIFKGLECEKDKCEEAITQLCQEKLDIQRKIYFMNVHKMGKKGELVIARFARWEDRCEVLFSAKKLKGTNVTIQSDLPDSLRRRRSELAKRAKEMRDKGEIVRIVERSNSVVLQIRKEGKWVSE